MPRSSIRTEAEVLRTHELKKNNPDQIIAIFPVPQGEMRVVFQFFWNRYHLHVRRYFVKTSGLWAPTRSGVVIPDKEMCRQIIDALQVGLSIKEWNEPKVIEGFTVAKGVLRVLIKDYLEEWKIDLRRHFYKGEEPNGEWIATHSGVSLSREECLQLIDALEIALSDEYSDTWPVWSPEEE